mgnify:CR=1 FL=1
MKKYILLILLAIFINLCTYIKRTGLLSLPLRNHRRRLRICQGASV